MAQRSELSALRIVKRLGAVERDDVVDEMRREAESTSLIPVGRIDAVSVEDAFGTRQGFVLTVDAGEARVHDLEHISVSRAASQPAPV